MIRLLFFGSDYKVGLTTALCEQILEIAKIHEVQLFVLSSENEMEPGLHKMLQSAHIQVHIIPGLDEHRHYKKLVHEIADIVNEHEINIINVHNNWQLALIAGIRLKRLCKKKFKLVYTIHGYRHNNPWKAVLAVYVIGLALLLFCDRVISMSSYVSRKFWFLKYKTNIIYYIMNKPEFNKNENQIETEPMRLVFPAQFRNGKNQGKLIRLIAEYVRKTGDMSIRVYLPGSGELLESCRELIREYRLEDQILTPGLLSHREIIRLYESCNIGLAVSNVETYGRCIAEPFALGRCVVTRRTGVAEDIIQHGENGFLFRSFHELLKILILLHEHPELIRKNADQAFADKTIFSAKEITTRYLDMLKRTLHQKTSENT